MEESHRKILKRKRTVLAEDLCPEVVLQYLIENNILNDHLVEKINCKPTTYQKNVELLNILPKRGPKAFHAFVNALVSSDHSHLAQALKFDPLGKPFTASYPCSFPPPSFSFPETTMWNHQNPNHSLSTTRQTENEDCCNISPTNTAKIQHADEEFNIPSPCDSLNDLLSTTPISALLDAADLTPVKSIHLASTSMQVIDNSSIVSAYDLVDGPTQDDLTVQRSNIPNIIMDCYKMTSTPRGLALIINIQHFEQSSGLENRHGAEVDRARLEIVLRQLGFTCYVLQDATGREIETVLMNFVSLEEHHHCCMSMVVVMSHGEEGCFFGRDGVRVEIDRVVGLFSNLNCQALHNKPKMLLFQSCRGISPDKGVDRIDGPALEKVDAIREHNSTSRASLFSSSSSVIIQNKLPSHSDCLVGYATSKGYAAMRNTKRGSWYIQALVQTLARHACDKDLLEIMTIVNNLVKAKEGWSPASAYHRCKEMSTFHSTLCKKVYMFPIP